MESRDSVAAFFYLQSLKAEERRVSKGALETHERPCSRAGFCRQFLINHLVCEMNEVVYFVK